MTFDNSDDNKFHICIVRSIFLMSLVDSLGLHMKLTIMYFEIYATFFVPNSRRRLGSIQTVLCLRVCVCVCLCVCVCVCLREYVGVCVSLMSGILPSEQI